MIVYNVTTKLEPEIVDAWLAWLRDTHIPDIVATGCFTHAVILHLIDTDDAEGPTYAVQYHAKNKEDYERYIEKYAPSMREKAVKEWGNKLISFRTVMSVVS
ncbi:MAG: DUF4286 family protein [Chitinophagaceae bacterium]|nr:DUF4286 family protein [Chitinophagaceae bacterium]